MSRVKRLKRMIKCTLCENNKLETIQPEEDNRLYHRCMNCHLIFADPSFHLSPMAELERYQHHHNGIDKPDYVNFLNRLIQPTLHYIKSGMQCLDYGCGPVPTISQLLTRRKISCYDYDPLFDFDHPLDTYDILFSSECFEHFHHPLKDLLKINSLLKPGGYLAVMTERWKNVADFCTWYYKMDPTHVSFYHEKTFHYIGEKFGYFIKYKDRDRVIILSKEGT